MKNLLVFGGTFDPIHWGHVRVAQAVQEHWHFDQFLFLPCQVPVLKAHAHASAFHRVQMIRAVLEDQPESCHFALDCREIERQGPSYMVTSLEELRKIQGERLPITLLLGYDSFCDLPQWHRWQELLMLANILVIQRQTSQVHMSDQLKIYMNKHLIKGSEALLTTSNGCIVMFDAGNYDISSTHIRHALNTHQYCADQLPSPVMHYIIKHQLYSS